jgi:hypothetical protein
MCPTSHAARGAVEVADPKELEKGHPGSSIVQLDQPLPSTLQRRPSYYERGSVSFSKAVPLPG